MRNNRKKPPKNPKKYRCGSCGWEGPGPLKTCDVLGCDDHCPKCGMGGVGPVWKGMKS